MVNMTYVRLLRSLKHKHGHLNGESVERTFRRLLNLNNPSISIKQLPYDNHWPEWFAQAASQLSQPSAGINPSAIEHIGSTSIKGMSSKGIIDMAVKADMLPDSEQAKGLLAKLGYQFYGVSPISDCSYWYWRVEQERCFVIHLANNDASCFEQPVLFRQYLSAHPQVRADYQNFKQQTLSQDQDLFSYSVRKLDFYCDIMAKATQWQQIND